VIEKVLKATRALRSNVYLWGGEPLLYRHWDGLVELLATDPRWTALCTNGTLIEKRFESLQRISRHLEVSISLDGFQSEHDSIRGQGSYEKAIAGIRLLVEQKKAGAFHGEVTVNFVLSDAMIHRTFDFISFLDREGVETAYLSFPWYISAETAAKMDRYFAQHFSWRHGNNKPSWYSYTFRLDPGRLEALKAEMARVDAADLRLKLRHNPRLDNAELHPFIMGSDKPAQNKTRCQSIRTRMDVFPNGDVVSCKFFPEFCVGNLKDEDLAEVWHGQRFNHVRKTVAHCGLMPVCAKCNLLYTRGA
jgi:radical SAM protein with 4Fe4S-binding SPASM domain